MKSNLYPASLIVAFVVLLSFVFVASHYLEWRDINPLHLELKNVGSSDIPYEIYVNGHLVQSGSIHINQTIIYEQSKEPWKLFGSMPFHNFLVSVVTPHTVHERIVDTRETPTAYFILD